MLTTIAALTVISLKNTVYGLSYKILQMHLKTL